MQIIVCDGHRVLRIVYFRGQLCFWAQADFKAQLEENRTLGCAEALPQP